MNLDGEKISSTGYFRVGYDKFSDHFLLEIRDTFGNDRYFVITKEQYRWAEKEPSKLEELVKENYRNSNFFFSTWEKENSYEQNKLMWKYTYIDMLLGKNREEIHRKLGKPDKVVKGTSDIEIFVMNSQLEIQIIFEGETCMDIDIRDKGCYQKIGILCACERELRPYLADMQNTIITEYAMRKFYSGRINGMDVVAVYSGCGKINAAITAQQLIDKYEVGSIIFSGIAGSLTDNVNIFDTVVCTSSEFRDTNNEIYFDFPILESPVFYADQGLLRIARRVAERADRDIHFGLATTGDIFTENISPDALCIDMETAAAAHTCYMCNVPFIAIRSISDNDADKGQEAIDRNFDNAAWQSYCFVKEMIGLWEFYADDR